ncbi:hypothetical protein D3C84_1007900 [compost metagenome]
MQPCIGNLLARIVTQQIQGRFSGEVADVLALGGDTRSDRTAVTQRVLAQGQIHRQQQVFRAHQCVGVRQQAAIAAFNYASVGCAGQLSQTLQPLIAQAQLAQAVIAQA